MARHDIQVARTPARFLNSNPLLLTQSMPAVPLRNHILMKPTHLFLVATIAIGCFAAAQENNPPPRREDSPPAPGDAPPSFGPGGRGGPGGPGGGRGMGPMREETKLLAKFDTDENSVLEAGERKAAREFLAKERAEGRGPRGFGPRLFRGPGGPGAPGGPENPGGPNAQGNPNSPRPQGGPGSPGTPGGPDAPRVQGGPDGQGGPGFQRGPGFEGGPGGRPGGPRGPRENQAPTSPGPKMSPADVTSSPAAKLYDTGVLRTLFLDFENADWEKELADFHDTDVEVPAKLTVDGKTYKDVGVHFRGMSSYMMIGEGRKRSLNVSMDLVKEKQDLRGYHTLNLLNSNGDPTMMRAVLYSEIARNYMPVPSANWMRVVINGECWGVYVNVQQFNKDFVEEWWGTRKGNRWKAPGSPGGRAGLEYLGDDVAKYKERFQIKSKDDPAAWKALVELCRVLNQTPTDQLVEKLSPILDIEGTLKFLALENALINTDGYWTRSSDFSLYREESGVFHIVPHDFNETFREPEGRGRNESDASPLALDPLVSAENERMPLLSKLLAVPALRTRYLALVREIAETWLNWEKLAPIVEQYRSTIADAVKADTRKLATTEAFEQSIANPEAAPEATPTEERRPRRSMSLKTFINQRRAYLLEYTAPKPKTASVASGE